MLVIGLGQSKQDNLENYVFQLLYNQNIQEFKRYSVEFKLYSERKLLQCFYVKIISSLRVEVGLQINRVETKQRTAL